MPISDELLLRATTPPDPIASRTRAQTLRSAMLANNHAEVVNPQIEAENTQKLKANDQAFQLGTQNLQQETYKTRQMQADLEDQEKLRGLLRTPATPAAAAPGSAIAPTPGTAAGAIAPAAAPAAGTNWDDILNRYQQSGAQPKNVFALQQMVLGNREKAATLAKTQGEVAAANQKLQEGETDLFAGLANTVKDTGYNPVALEAALHAAEAVNPAYKTHTDAIRAHLASGASIQSIIDPMISAATSTMTTALARKQTAVTGAQKQANEAPTQLAEAAAKQTALAGQLLGPATNQAEWSAALAKLPPAIASQYPGRFSPSAADGARRAGMTAEQQTQADQATATLAQTQRRDAETARYHSNEIGIRGAELGIQRQRLGFDLSGGISPVAQQIVDGRMDPVGVRQAMKSQPGLRTQVLSLDPKFDEANIESRYNTLKEFNNTGVGKAGGQAIALNTLIHHADLYLQTADALKNGTFRPGNRLYNEVATAFGAAPPTDAALVARFFAGETGKVATGGVPAEGEINGILSKLSTDGSPEQMSNAGRRMLQIAGGKAIPLIERAKHEKIDNIVQVLGPDAQEILKRRGFNPSTMQPAGAGGGAAAPQFKIGDPVMYNGAPHKIKEIKPNGKLVLE